MSDTILAWLGEAGGWAWHTGLALFVLVNVVAITAVIITRDRALVNRWTGPWLGINFGVLGLGVGVPLLTGLIRLALGALPTFGAAAVHGPK